MAEIFDFYINDNRSITFKLSEPIMLEDNGVSDWRFHIPNTVNGLDATGWQWWLVYVNAKNEKYTIPLTLEYDYDRPDAYSIATYTVDYGMSCKVGNVKFSIEAIDADTGGTILHEWHTKTYTTNVVDTLQGNQVEYAETESDIISALLIEVRNRVNQLVGGATPTPVSSVSEMLDTNKLYLLTTDGEWYYYNGTAWVSGGVYGAGVVDSVPTQGSTNAVSSGGVYDEIADLKDDLSESDVLQKLLHDNVPDTVQNYTFTDGTVSKVEHKSGNVIKRSDVFTYGTSSITEVRTLDSGESLTIVTNLSTLETTVTYQGAIPYQKIYSINDAVQGAWVYSNGSYSNNGRTDRAGSKMLGYTPQIGDVIKVEDSLKRYKFTTGTGTNNYRTTSTDDLVVDQTAMATLKTILFVKVDNSDFTNDDLAFLNQNTHVYRRVS